MSELVLRRKDGTEETITWDEFNALVADKEADLNPTEHVNTKPLPTRIELSDAKVADREAQAQAAAELKAKVDQTNAIYAPIEYPLGSGVFYDPRRFADFEAMRSSQGRGKLARAPIFDVNGVPQQFATSAEIKALVDYIEDTVTARSHAAYDAIFN